MRVDLTALEYALVYRFWYVKKVLKIIMFFVFAFKHLSPRL